MAHFPECSLCIDVTSMDGTPLQFTAHSSSLVRSLKLRIAEEWDVPVLCQRLASSEHVLENGQPLGAYCTDFGDEGAALSLTLVLTNDELFSGLTDNSPTVRIEAVEAVCQFLRGTDTAIQLIARRLSDSSRQVQVAASGALGRVAEQGDDRVVEEVCRYFADADEGARKAAMDTLRKVAVKGHAKAIELVSNLLLPDAHPLAKSSALQVVPALVEKGDELTTDLIVECCNDYHGEDDVPLQALKALGLVAKHGDAKATDRLKFVLRIADSSAIYIRLAVGSLAELVLPDDTETIGLVSNYSDNRSEAVRGAVMEFMARFAKPGDPKMTRKLIARVADSSDTIRRSAIRALSHVLQEPREDAVCAMALHLEHWHKGVRTRAVEACALPAFHGLPSAISAVQERMTHSHDWVRVAAVQSLGKLYPPGSAEGIAALRGCMQDHSAEVVQAALNSLRLVAEPGDPQMLETVCGCLRHHDSWVRAVAAEALGQVGSKGNASVTQALVAQCSQEQETSGVLEAVLTALVAVSTVGNDEALDAASSCLEHRDNAVRLAALEAIRCIAPPSCQRALQAVLSTIIAPRQDSEVVRVAVKVLAGLADHDISAYDTLRQLRTDSTCRHEVRVQASDAFSQVIIVTS